MSTTTHTTNDTAEQTAADRITAITDRTLAATDGPWGFYDGSDYADVAADYQQIGQGSYSCRQHVARLESEQYFDDPEHEDWDDEQAEGQLRADAEFIAHARTDVPWLLAQLAAVTAERDQLAARLHDSEATS